MNSSQSSYVSTCLLHIYSILISNESFSPSRTPKHLLEGTLETKLLSMEITLDKSPDLVFKLYAGWNWSLLTVASRLDFSNNLYYWQVH